MNPVSDNDDEYLLGLVDYKDEDLIEEDDFVEDEYGYRKNYDMLRQLILDAGSNYIEGGGLTKLEYYLDNLTRLDPLKSFIDDQYNGLVEAAYFLLAEDGTKTEAILRYLVGHKNVKFNQENVVSAAGRSKYIFFKSIEAGGNIHYKSLETNSTTLHIDVLAKRTSIVKYLLDQNFDVICYNQHTYTALDYAFTNISLNNLDIIELLIQKGADMYLRDRDSLIPFEYAIKLQRFDNVTLLLNSKLTGNTITLDLMRKGEGDCLLNDYDEENSREYIASVLCGLENDIDYNKIFGKELPVPRTHIITIVK